MLDKLQATATLFFGTSSPFRPFLMAVLIVVPRHRRRSRSPTPLRARPSARLDAHRFSASPSLPFVRSFVRSSRFSSLYRSLTHCLPATQRSLLRVIHLARSISSVLLIVIRAVRRSGRERKAPLPAPRSTKQRARTLLPYSRRTKKALRHLAALSKDALKNEDCYAYCSLCLLLLLFWSVARAFPTTTDLERASRRFPKCCALFEARELQEKEER